VIEGIQPRSIVSLVRWRQPFSRHGGEAYCF